MHIGNFGQLGSFIWPVVIIAGLVVIGAVFSKRAGAGSGRMWAGLAILIVLQLISGLWVLIVPRIFELGIGSFGALSATYIIVSSLAMLAAIALLASAATVGRTQGPGFLDPTRPGSPPTSYGPGGYQGTGYPPEGEKPGEKPPSGPGSNPYV